MMKKVLIITYYWPPMGGGGVQRWLKFSKYLREFGWEPVIYTPLDADVSNPDPGLIAQVPSDMTVIRHPIWEPFELYKKFLGKSGDEKIQPGFLEESKSNSFMQKLAVWIRGNLFIPDAKRFWIKPSIQRLLKEIPEHDIHYIISTGPPHSNHLIALALKKKLGIKWLADFRDPWTNIDYYDKLMLTRASDRRHRRLERNVLHNADQVVTVSWSWAEDFEKQTGIKPEVVTNGFDPEDFLGEGLQGKGEKLIITHIGSLNKDRNPMAFWKAVETLVKTGSIDPSKFLIRFIGPTDISAFNEVERRGLSSMIDHQKHMAHAEVVKFLLQSDLLLLPLNDTPNIDGVIPGKLYEYLASKRPILCIGKPDGDAAHIISETAAGGVFDFKDADGIAQWIKVQYDLWNSNGIPANSPKIEIYSRKNLAGKIAGLLEHL